MGVESEGVEGPHPPLLASKECVPKVWKLDSVFFLYFLPVTCVELCTYVGAEQRREGAQTANMFKLRLSPLGSSPVRGPPPLQ